MNPQNPHNTINPKDDAAIATHQDIAAYLESLAPPPGGDEGFKFGNPRAETTGVLVCWMATLEAMSAATKLGHNLIIAHEELHVPYSFRDPALDKYLAWPVNYARFSTLAKNDLTIYRAHGQLDRYCILDTFGETLGLPAPSVSEGYYRIYDIEPTSVRALALRVKESVGLSHLRVSGDVEKIVKRVGAPWGGLGLSLNVGFINGLLEYDPDVLIAGECDEYAFRFTEDAAVPMIETSHAASENPGLERFAEALQGQFPDVPVAFHEVPCPWQTL